ncbi:uncharacterized protein GGS25DRAFT_189235 [Hypoxylon fragiforme]|uniref:uncharacterized protein n=1 Tax=Hypoxylon fragiforme TaxID=63214 RepID=UPI0020C63B74|nr:uncharacterized protein GGS25DRAFT_189235 [Hypoxylon fragiforme]KAI2611287.1 hypothetical protein GGS25DRAFT_189235 [Hypoxylon fragiforme]
MTNAITLQQKTPEGKTLISEPVFNIFQAHLQPANNLSASQAALSLANLAPKPNDGEKTLSDGFFFELWNSVIGVAEQIPHDHPAQDQLVKVMRELTLLPDTGLTVWDSPLWTSLPVLGAAIRERLNGPTYPPHPTAAQTRAVDESWVRFHAFAARLMGAGVVHSASQPVWMLRDALEQPPQEEEEEEVVADRDLAAAAMYIEYAGAVLVEAVAANPEPALGAELARLLRAGPLYGGAPGLSRERWGFWAKRFREEGGEEKGRSEEGRAVAGRAARLMEVWGETRLKG